MSRRCGSGRAPKPGTGARRIILARRSRRAEGMRRSGD